MAWLIKCTDSKCGRLTSVANIVDLLSEHRDGEGWFLCQCGKHGYVEKTFRLQEADETWTPLLRGAIPLGNVGDVYQPFVFLCGYEGSEEINDIWFSYYKDLRSTGGRLKLGYGPGGPPVLSTGDLLNLLRQLVDIGYTNKEDIRKAVEIETTVDG